MAVGAPRFEDGSKLTPRMCQQIIVTRSKCMKCVRALSVMILVAGPGCADLNDESEAEIEQAVCPPGEPDCVPIPNPPLPTMVMSRVTSPDIVDHRTGAVCPTTYHSLHDVTYKVEITPKTTTLYAFVIKDHDENMGQSYADSDGGASGAGFTCERKYVVTADGGLNDWYNDGWEYRCFSNGRLTKDTTYTITAHFELRECKLETSTSPRPFSVQTTAWWAESGHKLKTALGTRSNASCVDQISNVWCGAPPPH